MDLKTPIRSLFAFAALALPVAAFAAGGHAISKDLDQVMVKHQGKSVTITRAQEHRNCPPFCVQPMKVASGVETVGELEVLDYLAKAAAGDDSILVVDSRTPEWLVRGTIPGSVSVPWTRISVESASAWDDTAADTFRDELVRFGVTDNKGILDFSNAKTLVLFCNGAWCGQSSVNVKTLLKHGYPADKLKWYRGGMQSWSDVGLTVAK